jgi:RNA polymerase sigma-70 factor, ECF subfamily
MKKKKLVMSQEELLLLDRLRQGESQAVAQWFNQYRHRLLRFVLLRVSNKVEAEEIVQETFINCLKSLGLFRGRSGLWTWMCSIARHEVADYYRKKYAKRALKTIPLMDFLANDEVVLRDSHDVALRVMGVLRRMSRHYRELLQLKYIDNKKVKVIASQLDKTVKSVESDLFRARAEFRHLWLTYKDHQ